MKAAAAALLALALAAPAWAQFRQNEPVEYLAYGKWEPAVFLRMSPDGRQAVIREKPSQFYPEGFERTVELHQIRARQPEQATAAPEPAPIRVSRPRVRIPAPTEEPADAPAGDGQMTLDEILGRLRAEVGTDGAHPRKDEVCQALVREIKRRGVDFRDFDLSELIAAGGYSGAPLGNVGTAIEYNYGTPATLDWLLGEWGLSSTSVYDQNVFDKGFVVIERDGKYLWARSADATPDTWINGTWRKATPEEMYYTGGAGVVLLKGDQGYDWAVIKDSQSLVAGEWITLHHVRFRQTRLGGKRSQD